MAMGHSNEIRRIIMDILKQRKLSKFSPGDEILQWKCETPRFLLKHVTSEQKVLSSANKIPTEDKITSISWNFVFKSK